MKPLKSTRSAAVLTLAALAVAALVTLLVTAAVAAPIRSAALQATDTLVPAQPATPVAGAAAASQASMPFLTMSPEAGFPLDPFLVSLQGGGPVEAATVAVGCAGYVTAAPSLSVDYKGQADLIRAFFYSDGDTTLVIQTPDGEFLCNDDTSQLLLDPTVEITKPAKGRYNLWAGSARAEELVPGFLVLTSHDDVTAASLAVRDLVKRSTAPEILPLRPRLIEAAKRVDQAAAAIKSADGLKAGGDPVTRDITASGDLPAAELQTGDTLCGGLVTITPDYVFDWTGDAEALSLLVEAKADTTLLVRTPASDFLCADDADGTSNLNPLLVISDPAEGRYLVWVGRVDSSQPVSGTLTITEAADVTPAVLSQP